MDLGYQRTHRRVVVVIEAAVQVGEQLTRVVRQNVRGELPCL